MLVGLSELDFWEMTVGEVIRYIEARKEIEKRQAQEKASYDYLQATLISKGFAIAMGSKDTFPTIEEVYVGLFDDMREEKIRQHKMELSAIRFKNFMQSHNKKYEEVQTDNE